MPIEQINAFLQMDALQLAWFLFIKGGWLLFLIAFLQAAWVMYEFYKQERWSKDIQYVFLAVDVPKDNEQTLRAVEQLFATIAGAHMPLTWGEQKVDGAHQLAFSFEIVSIDGYLQYIIRSPAVYADLVKSAIYAQYPSAEITEVEDYAKDMPTKFPDPKYNVWGSELVLSNKEFYPIKTYYEFEDSLSQELKDPMAAILETMNNIRPGEQFWYQIIVIPTGFDFPKRANEFAQALAGKKKSKGRKGLFSNIFGPISDFMTDWIMNNSTLFNAEIGASDGKKDDMPSMMLHLTPGERAAIEAVEKKASKIMFKVKMRIVYIAPKEIFQSQRVVSAVFGSIKQFNYNDLNGLRPDSRTKTTGYYGFASHKKNVRRAAIMRAYKSRSTWLGRDPFHLNIEELATLYHFPVMTVRAPLLTRLETRKSEGPAYLPSDLSSEEQSTDYMRQQLETLKVHNDYYERKYALNKDTLKPSMTEAVITDSEQTNITPEEKGHIPTNLPIA